MAREAGVPFAGLWLDAPAALLLERVAARAVARLVKLMQAMASMKKPMAARV
ncbi:MAG: hypothetical protein IH827_05810 [Myxococcales bacterium]|nr:hypothetical protein [Myxococcales bacterium]